MSTFFLYFLDQYFFLTILGLLITVNGFLVIIINNPIYSILFLILTFISSSFLLILLNAEFIFMLFLVVYIGAVSVLFLFVVMMLNIKIIEVTHKMMKFLPIGIFFFIVMGFNIIILLNKELFYIKSGVFFTEYPFYLDYMNIVSELTNIELISQLLYSKYLYLIIIAGLILLVAMIGAIVLTLNNSYKNKYQDIINQIQQKFHSSIFLINTRINKK